VTWPHRPEGSALESFFQTWRQSVFQPKMFFRELPVPRPVGPAVLYYLLVGIPAIGITLFWRALFTMAMSALGIAAPEELASEFGGWMPVLYFLFSPVVLLLGLGISFTVTHLLLLILGGARRGAGTTMRVLCFAYGPALFAVVPFIGSFVGGVWSVILAIIGLCEGHRTDGWRAAVAILLPIVAAFFLTIVIFAMVFALAALVES
jgi:hypothetical protein